MDAKAVERARREKEAAEWLRRYITRNRIPVNDIYFPHMIAAHAEHVLAERWVKCSERLPKSGELPVLYINQWGEKRYGVPGRVDRMWTNWPEPPKEER